MTNAQPSNEGLRGFAHIVLAAVAVEAVLEYLLFATPVSRGYFPVTMALRGGIAATGGGAFGALAYVVGRGWLTRGTRFGLRRIVFAVIGTLLFLTLGAFFFQVMFSGIDAWVPRAALPVAAIAMLLVLYVAPPGARRVLSRRARVVGLVVLG